MQRFSALVSRLSPAERVLFGALSLFVAAAALFVVYEVNASLLVSVPARGGSLTEGVVGTARFINPILAISDADRDLTELVYAGLLRPTPAGTLIPDLAQGYTISSDGLTYTFTLKPGLVFQDGTPLTSDDVVFTVNSALDPTIKSPRRANWEGITVEKIDERTVAFHLKAPYAPFLENTTMGILPSHIWQNIPADQFAFSDYNVNPIGSGAYRVSSISKNSSGIPTSYELAPFENEALGTAHIAQLTVRFYSGVGELASALSSGDVQAAAGLSPETLGTIPSRETVLKYPLPRIFGVFFNQNQASIFTHIEVRKALDVAIDKDQIVQSVLGSYGKVIDSPLPPYLLPASSWDATSSEARIASARAILERNGWSYNETDKVYEKKKNKKTLEKLSFSLSTASAPELKQTAELLKKDWEALGVDVTLKVFDTGDLNQNVIRPRNYDALLFGEIVGRELDLFAFWHSSQRNDPGLNIALYTNKDADKLLETARSSSQPNARMDAYDKFASIVSGETPAIFLYSPDFIYIVPKSLKGIELGLVTTPAERFADVRSWYMATDKVWSFLAPTI